MNVALAERPVPIPGFSSLDSQWLALLNAIHTDPIEPSLFFDIEWGRFIEAAQYHGVLPVAAQRVLESPVRHNLSRETEQYLRAAYQKALMRSMPLVQEVHRVTRAFSEASIDIIPYKGPALAEQYWGSFGVRECVDIDFLVKPAEVARAGAILEQLRYKRVVRIPDYLRPALVRNASEEQFQHLETKVLLELQWAPSPRVFGLQLNPGEIWRGMRTTQLAGEAILSPSPEVLLLLLCIHGWKHNWSRLIWAGDVARLLQAETLDWSSLRAIASRDRCLGVLSLGVQIARRLFAPSVPLEMEPEPKIADLANQLISRMKLRQPCSYFDWHRFMLAPRDSHAQRLQQVLNFVVTPGLGEYQSCSLPSFLKFGYRAVRLARVLRLFPSKNRE